MLLQLDPGDLRRQADRTPESSGYSHADYAASFAGFGTPHRLEASNGWCLARPVPGGGHRDLIGLYPFLCCEDYGALAEDFRCLKSGMVSLAAVPDPMQALPTELEAVFDTVVPYKTHYIADLEVPFSRYMTRHHRRYVGKALAHITIEHAARPVVHADEWALLYSHLVTRRGIAGLRAFDPHSLGLQLAVPGCHYFRARRDDQTVGALVCYLDRGVAYAHLISTTPLGQTMLAQYALYWQAIEYFRGHARWFALGGTAGSEEPETGGLAFFKRGWATGSCVAYFCSKILDLETYENLVARYGAAAGGFFPAYRHGGF